MLIQLMLNRCSLKYLILNISENSGYFVGILLQMIYLYTISYAYFFKQKHKNDKAITDIENSTTLLVADKSL